MRRLVIPFALMLAGALVAPAGSAASADVTFGNQCQYSYDRYWRPVPIIFGGRLTDGGGAELAPGTQLAVGDTLRLENGTVSATLPSWILPFAYESGMVPAGDGELPVHAWLALEATNTAEGVVSPIELDTVARTQVVLTPSGLVDEERSSIDVVGAPVPTQTWTATGGEIAVRQALGDTLPALPVGFNGGLARVRGSLFVQTTLLNFRLFLDCLQGEQTDQGGGHTDALPGTLGTFPVPGWTATVDGSGVPGTVDADLLATTGPPRVGADARATLSGGVLRLRLTPAQRTAWLDGTTGGAISGTITVTGDRSAEGTQSVALTGTADAGTITLPLAASTWTAASATQGIDLRGPRELTLTAQVGGTPRTLTLERIAAADPYPFARILPTADPLTPVPTPTPPPGPAPTPTPTPTATPTPKPARVSVRSSKLKVAAKRRVAVALRCGTGAGTCRGTLRLRTAAKVRLGARKPAVVTVTRALRYSVAAGKAKTVRLTLSAKGRSLLRARRSVKVVVELRPSGAATIKRKLTLRR